MVWQLPAQFAPPAGQPGTTAIHADSSVFINWATDCFFNRGWMNIADTTLGYPNFGDKDAAIGKAGEGGALSLGDGGLATLFFEYPIYNGPGWDFVVFENAFLADFLEFAFVEVSSDGANFVRFSCTSLTDTMTQTGSFGLTDARKVNNLAGKYEQSYGTPFDLEELKGSPGLDINSISHVRVIDVVGSMNPEIASYDKDGRKINDPFPTPFPSGGFDLDAIGVIHDQTNTAIEDKIINQYLSFYPNPILRGEKLNVNYLGCSDLFLVSNKRYIPLGPNIGISTTNFEALEYLKIVDEKGNLVRTYKLIVLQ